MCPIEYNIIPARKKSFLNVGFFHERVDASSSVVYDRCLCLRGGCGQRERDVFAAEIML